MTEPVHRYRRGPGETRNAGDRLLLHRRGQRPEDVGQRTLTTKVVQRKRVAVGAGNLHRLRFMRPRLV
jgi:hypothetical protein